MGTQYALVCDSCGKAITDMNNRGHVLIFTTDPIADPQLDLCEVCIKGVLDDPKVKKANKTARDKIRAQMKSPQQVPLSQVPPANVVAT